MGNSASKKAKAEAEKNYAQASSDLAVRDQELLKAERGLEESQKKEARANDEAETLRKKCKELETLSTTLEQERQRHIAKLQAEARGQKDEMSAQKRVIESRTRERDEARKATEQLEEKVKSIEQTSSTTTEQFSQQRRELEEAAQARTTELEKVRTESTSLSEKIRLLEERYEILSEEFAAAKQAAEEKLAAAKSLAAEELSAAQAKAAEDLATAKASMSDSARNLTSVSTELANAKAALTATKSKYGDLQRTHNESVSRRTASYEAFTATKQELAEAQQKYLTLYKEHEKQGRDLQEHLSAAKKDVGDAQKDHETLKKAHEKLGFDIEIARKELRDERESHDRLKLEFAALQQKLANGGVEKVIPTINIQEVAVS